MLNMVHSRRVALVTLVAALVVHCTAFTTQQVTSADDDRCKFASWPFVVNVMTANSPPFMFVTRDQDNNTEFSGFSFDLLQSLAVNLNFCFTITAIADNATIQNIIQEVNKTVTPINFGIAAITITGSRFEVCFLLGVPCFFWT
jgi:hypothetical protein